MTDAPAPETFSAREDFPVEALPPWARDYVIALSFVLQVEPAVVALSVLGAAAIAVQGKAEISVRGGWVEPLAFWSLVALRSGNRKTPALLRPLVPLLEHERTTNELRRAYRARLAERRRQSGAKGKPDPSDPDPFAEAAPPDLELFGSDCTPESLALALAEQQESYAIVSDEPTALAEILGGLYSEGKKANTAIYMAGYSGSLYRRRRVKGGDAVLDRPMLSMVLVGQPAVFEDLTSRAALVDLGFVGRFLVAKPLDHLGRREIHDQSVPEHVTAVYRQRFREILAVAAREPLPDVTAGAWLPDPPPPWPKHGPPRHRLVLDDSARALHSEVEEQIEPLLEDDALLGELSDFGAKLSGLVARSAALLHVLCHPSTWHELPIDLATMGHAIEIGRFAFGEVVRIWSQPGREAIEDELGTWVLRVLHELAERNGTGTFTWSEARRRFLSGGGRGRIRTAQQLEEILETLADEGILEEIPCGNLRGRRWKIRRKLAS